MAQWLRDKNATVAWLYVHENPEAMTGDTKPNTHLLVHVPKRLKALFISKLEVWFDAMLDGAVKAEPRSKPSYRGPDQRLQYMCKGADVLTCHRYGGHRKKGGQGVVLIKRSGVSRNLDWKARSHEH